MEANKTNSPAFSIIVPIYNVEKYLKNCLNSILNQTYTNFELLLIDDGSLDNSGTICDKYAEKDSRIRVFHKKNEGPSRARNLGIDNAKGEYITFVDSDDWIENNLLEECIKIILNNKVEIIKWGYYTEYCNKQETIVSDKVYILDSPKTMLYTNDESRYSGFIWNTLYKSSIIKKLHFNVNLCWCEDHILTYQAFKMCKSMYILNKPLYHYNIRNNNSLSDVKNPYMVLHAAKEELKIREYLVGDSPIEREKQYKYYIYKVKKSIIVCYIYHKYKERKKYYDKFPISNTKGDNFLSFYLNKFIPFIIKDFVLKIKIKKTL